jgi:hypothetical protein
MKFYNNSSNNQNSLLSSFRLFLIISPLIILASCSKDSAIERGETNNTILLMKVNFRSYKFEGASEETIIKGLAKTDTLPIKVVYKSPNDFGYLTLYYQPTGDLIFDGSIIWMGTGKISYPTSFQNASSFPLNKFSMTMPDSSRFQTIFESGDIKYEKIWNAISNLSIVSEYMKSNKKIGVFLYTPGVGVGDPNKWDWIILMSK